MVTTSGTVMGAGTKPRELQGMLNRMVYHPAARALARTLAATPVTPNMVSLFGAGMVCATAILYARVGTPAAVLLGFAVHLLWHVVDGADGDLARMTGRAGPSGELVDGLCDYGGHAFLYVLLAMRLDDTMGWPAWALVVAAGVSRIAQSVFAESSRRRYQWWVYGIAWLGLTRPATRGAAGAAARLYLAASRVLTGAAAPIDRLVAGASADPAARARIARLARSAWGAPLAVQGALGANPRTILLGCAMLAQAPAAFFWIEATTLNALLVAGIWQQRTACRRLTMLIARGRD